MTKTFVDDSITLIRALCDEPGSIMEDIPLSVEYLYEKHRDYIEQSIKLHIGEVIRTGCVALRNHMCRL